jgi:hypothetical protein
VRIIKPSSHADPYDASAQIDLIGVPWLVIGEDLSATPNGGDARLVRNRDRSRSMSRQAGVQVRRHRLRWSA